MQELIPTQLPILVSHWVVQCVRPNVAPEPVQSDLGRRRLGTGQLKHARRDTQADVGRDYFDAGYPFCHLATSLCSHLGTIRNTVLGTFVNGINLLACLFREGGGSSEVSQKVAICRENIEFLLWLFFVLPTLLEGWFSIVQ